MPQEFGQPLVLTTPHMAGQPVKDAQWLLSGHSRFPGLATYKDGEIDGDYGPLTAQATKRAKFWLGYVDSACTGVFGAQPAEPGLDNSYASQATAGDGGAVTVEDNAGSGDSA